MDDEDLFWYRSGPSKPSENPPLDSNFGSGKENRGSLSLHELYNSLGDHILSQSAQKELRRSKYYHGR